MEEARDRAPLRSEAQIVAAKRDLIRLAIEHALETEAPPEEIEKLLEERKAIEDEVLEANSRF